MRDEVIQAALAGLLHDIGKLAQRAGQNPERIWDDQAKKDFGYYHAALTDYFLQQIVPKRWLPLIRGMTTNHHRPLSTQDWIIALADRLSASERADPTDDTRAAQPKQLQSILSLVHEEGNSSPAESYLPLKPLALGKDTLFPGAKQPDAEVYKAYEKLWDSFLDEAKALCKAYEQSGAMEMYLESMLWILQRYTWCVPSAYFKARPDVSLYDHSRMTAALAVCLQDGVGTEAEAISQAWQVETPDAAQQDLLSKPVALLVGGDISGVQDFIYTISSKGAARMLRGRSFYLQLLTEAVLRFVLRSLELPYTNVIYSGGGHFFLLAPPKAAEQLPDLQAQISRLLLAQHGSSIRLVLGSAEVPVNGFRIGELPKHWGEMHAQLSRAKNRPYVELGNAIYQQVFAIETYGGNPEQICAICGDDQRKTIKWDELEAQERICLLCHSFAKQIGKKLPQARFVALEFTQPTPNDGQVNNALDILAAFGMKVQFLEEQEPLKTGNGQFVTLWALDDLQNNNWPKSDRLVVHTTRYTVNQIPLDQKGAPLTFDELQKECQSGFKRLGVLRMDVDNLGDIFSKGLGNRATLARLSTLSFQITLFFEGWLKRLIEKQGLIYAVYSGGDDLFLIGPWDCIPELAQTIVNEFQGYVSQNPALHLSAGMAFVDGKYPIYQAADDAAKAEEHAKAKEHKNAFYFLGEAWYWSEFEQLAQKKKQLVNIVKSEQGEQAGPKSLLGVLRSLAQMESEAGNGKKRPLWGRWIWLGTYLLTRAAEQYQKRNPNLAQQIQKVHEALGKDFKDIFQWGVAARWAQLETRKNPSSKTQEVLNVRNTNHLYC